MQSSPSAQEANSDPRPPSSQVPSEAKLPFAVRFVKFVKFALEEFAGCTLPPQVSLHVVLVVVVFVE
jgi:hypothetical protein